MKAENLKKGNEVVFMPNWPSDNRVQIGTLAGEPNECGGDRVFISWLEGWHNYIEPIPFDHIMGVHDPDGAYMKFDGTITGKSQLIDNYKGDVKIEILGEDGEYHEVLSQ